MAASVVAAYRPIEYRTASFLGARTCCARAERQDTVMKVRNSLKSAKLRDKNCQIVRRKGRVYLINKKNPRFKARQG